MFGAFPSFYILLVITENEKKYFFCLFKSYTFKRDRVVSQVQYSKYKSYKYKMHTTMHNFHIWVYNITLKFGQKHISTLTFTKP